MDAPEPMLRILRLSFEYWQRHPLSIAFILVSMLGITAIEVMLPVFTGNMINAITTTSHEHSSPFNILLAIVALGVIHLTIRDLILRTVNRLTSSVIQDMTQRAFWHVQRLSTDWHSSNLLGETIRKITRGTWAIDSINEIILVEATPTFMVLLIATVLLSINWPIIGLITMIGVFLFVSVSLYLTSCYVIPAAQQASTVDSELSGRIADAIAGNAIVKSFGAELREDTSIAQATELWRQRTVEAWDRSVNSGSIQNLIVVALNAVVLYVSLSQWQRGLVTVGGLAYVMTTHALIHSHLRDIGLHARILQRAVGEMEEFAGLVSSPLDPKDSLDAPSISISRGQIDFKAVSFRYPGQPRSIYDRISLTIHAGERVGIVGRSGSGKSTFIKLLQRHYDLEDGNILIDDQDISKVTQESLRHQIALVPQEPMLFHRTLAENIAYGKPNATMTQIIHAAKQAYAHDFISQLPNAYNTPVGERGVRLSGGERQRIALARAILTNAPILVLDEATSNLDGVSESLIQNAIEELISDRTTIIVAHRLSIMQKVDRILVFDHGKLVEQGAHAELSMKKDGHYYHLLQSQAMEPVGDQQGDAIQY